MKLIDLIKCVDDFTMLKLCGKNGSTIGRFHRNDTGIQTYKEDEVRKIDITNDGELFIYIKEDQ